MIRTKKVEKIASPQKKPLWPPNYTQIFKERQERYLLMENSIALQNGAKEYYRTRPTEFINDWCITYDPRNAANKIIPTLMPFTLFDRQKDFVVFIYGCLNDKECGLVEKCRDVGATWICVGITVHLWLFWPGSSVGWGSRKEQLVDKIGDPDSIFEKIRMQLEYLPAFFFPKGFNTHDHCSFMKIINPENGATITGEGGDNIGRGGRKSIYFKDESAHYERPEKIEAALGDNTDVQIDISSVNGTGNVFHRRRESGEVWDKGVTPTKGETRVFIFDWNNHPAKTLEWYETRRAKAEKEGLLHKFAQEVDRDYSASVEGVLIPAIWVKAAIDFHKKFKIQSPGKSYSALDLADDGGDHNAYANRKGIILRYLDEWSQGDTGETTNKAILLSRQHGTDELHYDCIGIGATAKAEGNRLKREGFHFGKLEMVPWAANASVQYPKARSVPDDQESPFNEDVYSNLKAQAWWNLRTRFEKTYKFVTKGIKYDIDELISIDSEIKFFHKLIQQLSQPTYNHRNGKIAINKSPEGTKSPDLADSVNMAYFPALKQIRKAGAW